VKLDPGAHVFYAFGFALKSGCDTPVALCRHHHHALEEGGLSPATGSDERRLWPPQILPVGERRSSVPNIFPEEAAQDLGWRPCHLCPWLVGHRGLHRQFLYAPSPHLTPSLFLTAGGQAEGGRGGIGGTAPCTTARRVAAACIAVVGFEEGRREAGG
jgi:hypothetical protein